VEVCVGVRANSETNEAFTLRGAEEGHMLYEVRDALLVWIFMDGADMHLHKKQELARDSDVHKADSGLVARSDAIRTHTQGRYMLQ
jgi:hypothetical protein